MPGQIDSWGPQEDVMQAIRATMADYSLQSFIRGRPQSTAQNAADGTAVATAIPYDTTLGLINYSGMHDNSSGRKIIRHYNDDHSVLHYDTSGNAQHGRTPAGNTAHGQDVLFGSGGGVDGTQFTPMFPYWRLHHDETPPGGATQPHQEGHINTTTQMQADEVLVYYHGLDSHGMYFLDGSHIQFNETHVTYPDGSTPAILRVATVTLGAAMSSYTFSAISSTYNDLIVEVYGRGDAVATSLDVLVQANGDTSTNYDYVSETATQLGVVSSTGSYGVTSSLVGSLPASLSSANMAGSGRIYISQYTGVSFYKAIRGEFTNPQDAVGNLLTQHTGGVWHSTTEITSLTLLASSGNFVAGTTFSLYGSW